MRKGDTVIYIGQRYDLRRQRFLVHERRGKYVTIKLNYWSQEMIILPEYLLRKVKVDKHGNEYI